MKVFYSRVSAIDGSQRHDRQIVNSKDYDLVIQDKVSGTVPFFERQGGKQIETLLKKGVVKEVHCHSIDRAGRDLKDILNTLHYFTTKGVCVHFISQGIRTLDDNGKENAISKLMISVLGCVAEMERNMIKERQREGIYLAKLQGRFLGRQLGSVESVERFLAKPKNKTALNYLKKGYSNTEAAKLADVHYNTILKIRKIGLKLKEAI